MCLIETAAAAVAAAVAAAEYDQKAPDRFGNPHCGDKNDHDVNVKQKEDEHDGDDNEEDR